MYIKGTPDYSRDGKQKETGLFAGLVSQDGELKQTQNGKVYRLSHFIRHSVFVQDVELQTCRRNVGQNVAVGVCREYLGGGGADAGIAVDLAVLHRHELALVVGHIVEHRTVELHVAAPVIFVAADLDRALRDEGLDDKGSRGSGGSSSSPPAASP